MGYSDAGYTVIFYGHLADYYQRVSTLRKAKGLVRRSQQIHPIPWAIVAGDGHVVMQG